MAVALYHLPLAFHLFSAPLVREAYVFVDFFFVLSGFVIAHAYGARLTGGAELGELPLAADRPALAAAYWRRLPRWWRSKCMPPAAGNGLGSDVRPPFSGETALE